MLLMNLLGQKAFLSTLVQLKTQINFHRYSERQGDEEKKLERTGRRHENAKTHLALTIKNY